MINYNTHTFIGCDKNFTESDIVVFGAPFDGTTSYRPGTRFGPSAIRNESYGIETYSPYLDKDLTDINVFDCGDLDLPFGNTNKTLDIICKKSANILKINKTPFMIGGEHLITLAGVKAAYNEYPNLHIVHFDAHADLRDQYLGESLSHACVMRRCWEYVGDNKIYQFAIRSGDKEEFSWGKDHIFTNMFNFNLLDNVVKDLSGKPVYFTLDLDVLDPSIFPATGTPEAGGVTFNELLEAINKVMKLNIVAVDINELSPIYDQTGVSTAVACKIVREILLQL